LAESRTVTVLELKPDFDPWGGAYVQVSFGYQIPTSSPQPGQPAPIAWKHAIHLFIPKERWKDQYKIFSEWHMITRDDNSIELKPKVG
jgi:hypothetical protein